MAQEFSEELNKAQLDAILKRIQEEEAQRVAQAQGAAITRGITGGTFEARGIQGAQKIASDQSTQAALAFAIENANRMREERMIKEQRTYESGEAEKSRLFGREERIGSQDFAASQNEAQQKYQSLEAEKQRAYQTGQYDLARKFEAEQAELQRQYQTGASLTQHERDKSEAARQGRRDLINTGISTVGSVVGGLFCFSPFTKIEMADGSVQSICSIKLGDNTRGGLVLSIRHSLGTDLYNYLGIYVVGSHAVKENGRWIRVRESKLAVPTGTQCDTYNLITETHRIYVNGIEFCDDYETGLGLTIEDQNLAIAELNQMEEHSNGK